MIISLTFLSYVMAILLFSKFTNALSGFSAMETRYQFAKTSLLCGFGHMLLSIIGHMTCFSSRIDLVCLVHFRMIRPCLTESFSFVMIFI